MLHEHPQQHRSGDSGGACTERNRPTATLIVESSILNPREEQGGVFSHTPDSHKDATSRRARECMSGASSNRLFTDAATLTESHTFCWYRAMPSWGCHDHVTTGLGPRPGMV